MREMPGQDSVWKRGVHFDAVVGEQMVHSAAQEYEEWYARFDSDLWLVYLNKVLVTENTARSLEQFGYGVVVEHRSDFRFDEPGDAAIVAVDLSEHEAEQLLQDFIKSHQTPEALEQAMEDSGDTQ